MTSRSGLGSVIFFPDIFATVTLIHKQIIAVAGYYACSAFIYLQVVPILPTKFQVSWPFISEEDGNHGGQHRFHKGMVLAPSYKVLSQLAFSSGDEA